MKKTLKLMGIGILYFIYFLSEKYKCQFNNRTQFYYKRSIAKHLRKTPDGLSHETRTAGNGAKTRPSTHKRRDHPTTNRFSKI